MAKSAQDLVNERFGVVTRIDDDSDVAQAQVADAILLRANPMRYAFVFVNLSASNIFIRYKLAAAATAGLIALPNGTINVSLENDFTMASGEWHILGAAANLDFELLSVLGEPDGP